VPTGCPEAPTAVGAPSVQSSCTHRSTSFSPLRQPPTPTPPSPPNNHQAPPTRARRPVRHPRRRPPRPAAADWRRARIVAEVDDGVFVGEGKRRKGQPDLALPAFVGGCSGGVLWLGCSIWDWGVWFGVGALGLGSESCLQIVGWY